MLDGAEVEWSATGRREVSMAQLAFVHEVAFAFAREASRLDEMKKRGLVATTGFP